MAETRILHYEKPPIQEAIISVRLSLPEQMNIPQLDNFYNLVKESLPQKNYAQSLSFKFDSKTGSSAEEPQVAGILLKSADGTRALQVNKDAFIFSYLNQYSNWEEFLAEGLKYLASVFDVFQPIELGPLGTRFINNISVPARDYSDSTYFDTKISFKNREEYPTEYLIQYVEELGDITCNVVQTRNSEQSQKGKINIILDIDAMLTRTVGFDEALNPKSDAWQRLREVKNMIFNDTVSQKAKEEFNG